MCANGRPSAPRCATSRSCASALRCSTPRSARRAQFMYHCAWRVTQGHDVVQDVSMLKALTGELVNEVVQLPAVPWRHGLHARDAIERLWRDARMLAIGGGATEVMLDEVAKRIERSEGHDHFLSWPGLRRPAASRRLRQAPGLTCPRPQSTSYQPPRRRVSIARERAQRLQRRIDRRTHRRLPRARRRRRRACIVLAGNGTAFCAGADLNWMKRMADYSREENRADAQRPGRRCCGRSTPAPCRRSRACRATLRRRRRPGGGLRHRGGGRRRRASA